MFAILATGNYIMKKILIIGATSAIAIACARTWANEKACLFLVARNQSKLQQMADDLSVLGASAVHTCVLDVNDFELHKKVIEECFSVLEKVDIALIAHGTLPNQSDCEQDVDMALDEFSSNGLSVISILTLLANRMERQSTGTIAVISSVAGDRGRPSNYLYGTAKAAVSVFCEGLRARLFKLGIHVMTVKPGFVDTPMTKGLALPGILVSSPEKVAFCIDRGIKRKSNTIYTPYFWAIIMLIIKAIPTTIFKRLSI